MSDHSLSTSVGEAATVLNVPGGDLVSVDWVNVTPVGGACWFNPWGGDAGVGATNSIYVASGATRTFRWSGNITAHSHTGAGTITVVCEAWRTGDYTDVP